MGMNDTPREGTTEHEDERDTGAEPQPQQQAQPETLDLQANPQGQPNGLKQAATLVPVGPHGASPTTFENQITFAQFMAKATNSLPEYLRGNVGDCLALVDMCSRSNLSPYMMAGKTYVDPRTKRMAFESQAYHAFLIGSGWLKDSALHVSYEGEGDARTCKVWGTLKGESEPRYHTSPPLGQLRPKRNETGQIKGSPLWDKKPDVQMFYDTSRDWSRMFSPIATLGMLDAYETLETPIDQPQIEGQGHGLKEKLKGADATTGHKSGHAETELAKVAADKGGIAPAGDEPNNIEPAGDSETKAATKGKNGKGGASNKATVKAAADRAEKTASDKAKAQALAGAKEREKADKAKETAAQPKVPDQNQQTDEPKPVKVPTKPKDAAEYQIYCIDWIDNKESDPDKAMQRWDAERDMRDDLVVRTGMRNDLRERIEKKHGV